MKNIILLLLSMLSGISLSAQGNILQLYPQVYKVYSGTTAVTGSIVWNPETDKRIVVTSVVINTYGTTTGKLTLWYGDSVAINDTVKVLDTVYTAGTDQPLIIATFSPSSTLKPQLVFNPIFPIFCSSSRKKLKLTVDAAMSCDVVIYGYEW